MCFSTAIFPLFRLFSGFCMLPLSPLSIPDAMDTSLSLRDTEGPYFLCEETGPDCFPLYLPSHTPYKAIGNLNCIDVLVFFASCAFTGAKTRDPLNFAISCCLFLSGWGLVRYFEALFDSKVVKPSQLVPFSLTGHFSQVLIATLYLFSLWPKVSSYWPTALLPSWWM